MGVIETEVELKIGSCAPLARSTILFLLHDSELELELEHLSAFIYQSQSEERA